MWWAVSQEAKDWGHPHPTSPTAPELDPEYGWSCRVFVFFEAFLVIYFWWHWVFIAACRLSLAAVSGATVYSGAWAWPSPCGGFSCGRAWAPGHAGSVVVLLGLQSTCSVLAVHRLSCSVAYGISSNQGSNPRPLHWQVDSLPLDHEGRLELDSGVWGQGNTSEQYGMRSRVHKNT